VETVKHATIKTAMYEAIESLIHFLLVFVITGKLEFGLGFVILERTVCTCYYFTYEIIWTKIRKWQV